MIVLGKDKIDERFNIDDNGTITDLNGNIQKVYIRGLYYNFKSVAVHKIQMWTKNEWRDGKTWHIHHKDKNKLNNNINNLEFLSKEEHNSLHKKGSHWKLSEETKKKMSQTHVGYLGKKHTKEWKLQHKNTLLGRVWINNGIIEKFVLPNNIPEGYIKGRLKRRI